MRSNQLEAWAEMARAIAHEIKNPLTPIQLSTEHLKKRLMDRGVLPAEDLDRCLDTVLKQVEALREIASEFNAYAKLPALNLKPVPAVQVFEQAVSPYRQSPPTGISIVSEHTNPEGLILVDAKAFIRALMNLIENAIQAMPEGGTLTCTLRLMEQSSGQKPLFQFIVRDTGVGIDDQTRARLYEPYFSTKSSGTGLGLAIVRRTIEAHQGTITVESEPDQGATFTISLPQHQP